MFPPADSCVNKTHFSCDEDQCLPRSALCDIFQDCDDGFDESSEAGCNGKVGRGLCGSSGGMRRGVLPYMLGMVVNAR